MFYLGTILKKTKAIKAYILVRVRASIRFNVNLYYMMHVLTPITTRRKLMFYLGTILKNKKQSKLIFLCDDESLFGRNTFVFHIILKSEIMLFNYCHLCLQDTPK